MNGHRPRLAVITSRFPYGLKESFLRDEIEELCKICDVSVIAALPGNEPLCGGIARSLAEPRLPIFSWHVGEMALREIRRSPLQAARAFATVVLSPRSLHAKLKNALIFPKALAVSRLVRERRIEHVHAYWLTGPATIAYVVSVLNGIAWSATGHRYDLVDFNITSVGHPRSGFVASARFVRAISQRGREQVRTAFGNRATAKIVTEHLGVRIPAHVASIAPESELRLVCAANLERVKGHDTLFSALRLASHAGIRLVCMLSGDGSQRGRLEALARELEIEELVVFEGAVAHERLLKRIQRGAYDAAILTSIDDGPNLCEGIPVFLMESMAAGLPVIATRSGGVGELVDERNGILCTPGDAANVARAIVALARDRSLRTRLGKAARATIERGFDVTTTATRVAALIFDETREAANAS